MRSQANTTLLLLVAVIFGVCGQEEAPTPTVVSVITNGATEDVEIPVIEVGG